jgi:hypothetical protein
MPRSPKAAAEADTSAGVVEFRIRAVRDRDCEASAEVGGVQRIDPMIPESALARETELVEQRLGFHQSADSPHRAGDLVFCREGVRVVRPEPQRRLTERDLQATVQVAARPIETGPRIRRFRRHMISFL